MDKKNKRIAIALIVLLIISILLLAYNYNYNRPPIINKIKYGDSFNEDKSRKVILDLKRKNKRKLYCRFNDGNNESEWILVKNNKCSYDVFSKEYSIDFKYEDNKITTYNEKFKIDGIAGIKFNNKKKYMALGETFNLETYLDYVGDVDTSIKYSSSDDNIMTVDENGNVTAHNVGTSTITAISSNNKTDSVEITVSSLIRPPVLNNSKKIVPCNSYTTEQVNELDAILKSRVEEAGEGTRAAVAVASRFLTLEFPYKVPYFYENGRLTGNGVQGEGRYYKKGLYLGTEKQNQITVSMAGPASWGCPLMNYEDDGYRKPNTRYPNGFDCSGYVTWVLVQAGLDLGDIGAGASSKYDYTDVGELRRNSYDLLHSGQVKVGDLIGWDGHIAIIGAMSDTKIYVTESLLPGVIMDEYDYSDPNARFYRRYDYIIDMSKNYKGDGNLRNMW